MSKLLPIQYAKVLYELTKDSKPEDMDRIFEVFVDRISKDQMINKIDYIISSYEKYSKAQDGIVELEIITARKVSDSIINKISKEFGTKVEINTKTDKSIIGGVVVRHASTILDASLKTQLKKLKRELI